MNSPADIVAKYLIDQSVVTAPSSQLANPIFIGQIPEKPNTAVGAFDGKSIKDGKLMIGKSIFHPAVQIIVRASDYRKAYDLAFSIRQKIDAIKNVAVSLQDTDYIIKSSSFTSDILSLGNDEDKNRRHLMSINFKVTLNNL